MITEIVFIKTLMREVTFYIGKTQEENFDVIDKGTINDLWFHAADMSSCHVVCCIPNDIDKKDLRYIIKVGAMLCKNNTNKIKSIKNVNIVYTKINNIIKTDIPGCVITKNTKLIKC